VSTEELSSSLICSVPCLGVHYLARWELEDKEMKQRNRKINSRNSVIPDSLIDPLFVPPEDTESFEYQILVQSESAFPDSSSFVGGRLMLGDCMAGPVLDGLSIQDPSPVRVEGHGYLNSNDALVIEIDRRKVYIA
jgi:hypothetical protein